MTEGAVGEKMKKRRNKNLIWGGIFTGAVLLLVLAGLVYTPYDPDGMDAASKNLAPSLAHWFGTDNYGRDLLSRVMVGARTTFAVGLLTVAIGGFFGTLVGLLTGYFGGWADELIMRLNDGILAFPSILLALAFVGMFGSGEKNIVLALGILFIPSIARVVRGEVLRQRELDYVTNAKLMGASTLRILFVHILPNLRQTLLVTMAIGFNNAVLAEAGLSFLGLGVQPPKASLGRMLQEAQSCLRLAPWYAVVPGAVIVIAVLGVTLLSEAFSRQEPAAARARRRRPSAAEALETPADVLLQVRELRVFLPGEGRNEEKEIVRQASFSVKPGEILGIVGESGSGKSMTAKAILGLLPEAARTEGSVCFRTEEGAEPAELLTAGEAVMRTVRGAKIAMVFQEPMTSLNPVKRIETQMLEVFRVHRVAGSRDELRSRLKDALREVELDDAETILKSYPHELSGGMRQRVMIAMSMLLQPRLLLADEPTTALDAQTQEEILTLLQRLQREHGTAVILISHDLSVIRKLCSRVLVMEQGSIVEQGSCEQIFTAPKETFTRKLLQAAQGEDFTKQLRLPAERPVVLNVHRLHVYFGKKKRPFRPLTYEKEVLHGFSMTVRKGDIYGILGRSGTGKSTLARCLCGLPTGKVAGQVHAEGRVGMVFQDPYSSLNPRKTVQWLFEEPLRNRGVPKAERRKEALAMLAAAGLPEDYAARRITELSGGERQRVAIGIALMARPEILILDEPVSALDVTVQEQILSLLIKLHNSWNLTYLLISHDESVIRRMTTDSSRVDA